MKLGHVDNTCAVVAIAAIFLFWLSPTSAAADPMVFELETTDVTCGACTLVYATGDFDGSTVATFQALLRSHSLPAGTTIVLNSPGGSLFDGMEIGLLIRENHFHTSVFDRSAENGHEGGLCASACAYAFLGGARRTVSSDARFGLHQFSGTLPSGDAVSQTQSVVSIISNYVRSMGASQEVVEIASAIPAQGIRWLSGTELAQLGMTTGRGTRFAPQWSTRLARTQSGMLMLSDSLLADGAVAQLQIICRPRDAVFDRGRPVKYGLLVTLPDPPGGLRGLRQYQLSPTTLQAFSILTSNSEMPVAEITPAYPLRVEYWGTLSFSVDIDASLLESLSNGFVLEWTPDILGRVRVDVPGQGFLESFHEYRAACEG